MAGGFINHGTSGANLPLPAPTPPPLPGGRKAPSPLSNSQSAIAPASGTVSGQLPTRQLGVTTDGVRYCSVDEDKLVPITELEIPIRYTATQLGGGEEGDLIAHNLGLRVISIIVEGWKAEEPMLITIRKVNGLHTGVPISLIDAYAILSVALKSGEIKDSYARTDMSIKEAASLIKAWRAGYTTRDKLAELFPATSPDRINKIVRSLTTRYKDYQRQKMEALQGTLPMPPTDEIRPKTSKAVNPRALGISPEMMKKLHRDDLQTMRLGNFMIVNNRPAYVLFLSDTIGSAEAYVPGGGQAQLNPGMDDEQREQARLESIGEFSESEDEPESEDTPKPEPPRVKAQIKVPSMRVQRVPKSAPAATGLHPQPTQQPATNVSRVANPAIDPESSVYGVNNSEPNGSDILDRQLAPNEEEDVTHVPGLDIPPGFTD